MITMMLITLLVSTKKANILELNISSSSSSPTMSVEQKGLEDLLDHLYHATFININKISVCPSLPCIDRLNLTSCSGLCVQNLTMFQEVLIELHQCYLQGFCGRNFKTTSLSNVLIKLPFTSYDGQCDLHGQTVTINLKMETDVVKDTSLFDQRIPSYVTSETLTYVISGLLVRCKPWPAVLCPGLTEGQGKGKGLEQGKGLDQGEGPVDKAFEATVTVYLDEYFDMNFLFSDRKPVCFLTQRIQATSFQLGYALPVEYETQVYSSLYNVFDNYLLFQWLQNNYLFVFQHLINNFYTKCPKC